MREVVSTYSHKTKMPKESLREKLDGNELDLSMNNLESVPVKELASLPRATRLDLSNNKISFLPEGFCNLQHVTRLDLSKNLLLELPKDFGNLENLQHLDLLGNQLKTLPRSFAQLKKLKWLDLKDNPLEPGLKKNAGDCLDETQCKKCAIRILMYMTDLDAQLEVQEQNKLKKQKELEAKQKAKQEKQLLKKRQEKKAEKERRRRELEAKRAQERLAQNPDTSDEETSIKLEKQKFNGPKSKKLKGGRRRNCISVVFLSFLALALALIVGIDIHCASASKTDEHCKNYWLPAREEVELLVKKTRLIVIDIYHKNIEPYFVSS